MKRLFSSYFAYFIFSNIILWLFIIIEKYVHRNALFKVTSDPNRAGQSTSSSMTKEIGAIADELKSDPESDEEYSQPKSNRILFIPFFPFVIGNILLTLTTLLFCTIFWCWNLIFHHKDHTISFSIYTWHTKNKPCLDPWMLSIFRCLFYLFYFILFYIFFSLTHVYNQLVNLTGNLWALR